MNQFSELRELEASAAVKRFCQTRYPGDLAPRMEHLWSRFLVTSQTAHWSMRGTKRVVMHAPQFHLLTSPWLTFTPQRVEELLAERDKLRAGLAPAPEVLTGLAMLAETSYDNPQWRRDAVDMARTISGPLVLGDAPPGMPERSSKAPARKALRSPGFSCWYPSCS